jgi:hypothetical protein
MTDGPRGTNWRRVALAVALAVVVALALLAGGLWLYGNHLYRTSYESSYTYDVAVNTNETLEDVTLYLPLPAGADPDAPDLGAAMVEEGNAVAGDFDYRVVDTERGPVLELSAERVVVEPRYYEYVERDGVGERVEINESEYDPSNPNMTRDANAGTFATVTVPSDRGVATDDPWAGEPLLSPRTDRRPAACSFPAADWLRCYEYDSAVYAEYGTSDTARVDVITAVEGSNAWWVFGWNYDSYRDRVDATLHGPQDGWVEVTGTVEVDTDRRDPPRGRTVAG